MRTHDGDAAASIRNGRHRRHHGRSARWLTAALVTLAVGGSVFGALSIRGGARTAATDCPRARTLHVSAAPEIAPAVALIAGRTSGPGCVAMHVEVTAADPAAVVAASRAGGTATPDVWIPDSSLWLDRLPRKPVTVTVGGRSVATSPIVLALAAPVARTLGPAPSFRRVAAASTTASPILLAAGEPTRSAAATGALAALYATLRDDVADLGYLAALLRTVAAAPTAPSARLSVRPLTVDESPVAVPTSEQAVWTADRAAKAQTYTAVYPPAPGLSLDYPYAVLTRSTDAGVDAATLLRELGSSAARAELAARGFRSPTGSASTQLTGQPGIDATVTAATAGPTRAQADAAVAALATVTKPSRMLALIDVSGSMALPVPGNTGASRIDVARAAAAEGLGLLSDGASAGLWRFSADLTPKTDYQQLVPLATLNPTTRAELAAAVTQLQPVPDGGTGLYDSILAAVRTVRADYDPTRVNSVVVLTDGKDEADAAHRIELSTLLAALRTERQSTRPVVVITIAYGPDTDAAALRSISAASGGVDYVSTDPRDLPKIFRQAVGQRLCQSSC